MKKAHRRPFWLIVKYRSGRMEVLGTTLASGEEALPIFGFEDEARMFLELGTSGCWQVREMTEAELTSVLIGPCAGVGRVVLDPLPGPFGETAMDLDSVGRRAFIESYLRKVGYYRHSAVPGVGEAMWAPGGRRSRRGDRDVEKVVRRRRRAAPREGRRRRAGR